jgi:hypothetical protein
MPFGAARSVQGSWEELATITRELCTSGLSTQGQQASASLASDKVSFVMIDRVNSHTQTKQRPVTAADSAHQLRVPSAE